MNNILKVAIICFVLAWYLDSPIPENFSAPWKLRIHMSCLNLGFKFMWLLDMLGICPYEQGLRAVASLNEKGVETPDDLVITDEYFDDVKCRVYRTTEADLDPEGKPALIFFHGGGWFFGNLALYENILLDITRATKIVAIFVHYRLAPENPFPVPFNDCVTATKYVLTHAKTLGINPARIAVGGDSSGGNLAAAVSLKLRDEAFIRMPKCQLLLYPALQAIDFRLPSFVQNRQGPLVHAHLMTLAWSLYATGSSNYSSIFVRNGHTTPEVKRSVYNSQIRHMDLPDENIYAPYEAPDLDFGSAEIWHEVGDTLKNRYVSPLMADNLTGLPAAYIFTPRYDVLRDEGYLYAKRLQEAKVEVVYNDGVSSFHGVLLEQQYREGQTCLLDLVEYIKTHL